jgi:hypothetical protein
MSGSKKGSTRQNWRRLPITKVMSVSASLLWEKVRFDQAFPNHEARENYLLKIWWRMFPFALDYMKDPLTDASILGRAQTCWNKSKEGENPYKNEDLKPYVPVVSALLRLHDKGTYLHQENMLFAANKRCLPSKMEPKLEKRKPKLEKKSRGASFAEFKRSIPYSDDYLKRKGYFPNQLRCDDKLAPMVLYISTLRVCPSPENAINVAVIMDSLKALKLGVVSEVWVVFRSKSQGTITEDAILPLVEVYNLVKDTTPQSGIGDNYGKYWLLDFIKLLDPDPVDVL